MTGGVIVGNRSAYDPTPTSLRTLNWTEFFPETAAAATNPGRSALPLASYNAGTTAPEVAANRVSVYVVDPFGYAAKRFADDQSTMPVFGTPASNFGFGAFFNFGGTNTIGYPGLARFSGGLRETIDTLPGGTPRNTYLGLANALVGLPDSFTEIARADAVPAYAGTVLSLPSSIQRGDLEDLALGADSNLVRIVVRSADGTRSAPR